MPALPSGDRVRPLVTEGSGRFKACRFGLARSAGGIALTLSLIEIHDALPGDDADSVRPGGPRLAELGDDIGPACSLILELGAVDVHVVKLPRVRMLSHELPAVAPDRGVAEMLPVECARLACAAPECGEHAAALER